ncbi:MAG: hypothetical protein PHP55_12110 [Methanoculleus sp.]|nr:hypothetical protein [Methanoculleus sp.]
MLWPQHAPEPPDTGSKVRDRPDRPPSAIYTVKYALFFGQWLVTYVEYLQRNYPYLFSLAMPSNPFDETASPVVR